MGNLTFFRSIAASLLVVWIPFSASAINNNPTVSPAFELQQQDKKKDRKESEPESKKPDIKEVPKSRKQSKPSPVKPDVKPNIKPEIIKPNIKIKPIKIIKPKIKNH